MTHAADDQGYTRAVDTSAEGEEEAGHLAAAQVVPEPGGGPVTYLLLRGVVSGGDRIHIILCLR